MLKRALAKVGLMVVSLLIVCLLLEIVLAFAKINTRENIVFDPAKGITHVPSAYYRHTKEGFSEGRFNSAGLRDVERAETKPPGVWRIAVLGDSYMEALEVDQSKTFCARLETKLATDCAPQKIEVLNLGQSGFGTTEEYLRYVNFGERYHPDVVLLAFYVGNDFRNNSRVLNGDSTGFYYRLEKDGSLVLDRSLVDRYLAGQTLPKRAFQWLKQRSYLASLLSERLYLLKRAEMEKRRRAQAGREAGDGGEAGGASAGDDAEVDEADPGGSSPSPGSKVVRPNPYDDVNIYLPSPPPEWENAFAITRGVLAKLQQAVKERGASLVVVVIGSPEQVMPERQATLRRRYGNDLDFDRPTRLVQGFAQELGVRCIPLDDVFARERARTAHQLHFGTTGRGHWTEEGHELAADHVEGFLSLMDLLGPRCTRSLKVLDREMDPPPPASSPPKP